MGYTEIPSDITTLLKTYWTPCPGLATYKFPKQKNRVREIIFLKLINWRQTFSWFWVEKYYVKNPFFVTLSDMDITEKTPSGLLGFSLSFSK